MTSTSRSLDFYKEIVDEYVKNDLHANIYPPIESFWFRSYKGKQHF